MSTNTGRSAIAAAEGRVQEVRRTDLPLHCPTPQMSLWDAHPRVYLPIEEAGEVTCPYCGTHYVFREN